MSRLPIRSALVAIALVLSASAAVCAPRAAAPAAPRNLLSDPDFERSLIGHDWMPTAWDTSEAGLSTVFFGRDSLSAHSGRFGVNIANTSGLWPMGHNWSQTLLVGRDTWGKQATFSVWTKTAGLQGRAYLLLQAYADTVTKMSRIWDVERDDALRRLGLVRISDPAMNQAWDREQFEDMETGWVRRQARCVIPPGTNVIFVRAGMFGVGTLMIDDASLTLAPAPRATPVAVGQNLFADPGFEAGGDAWEWNVPPFEGARMERDTVKAHTGRVSIHCWNMNNGMSNTRMGVCQPFPGALLAGKHVKISGWFRADSLTGGAYVKVWVDRPGGSLSSPTRELASDTYDWRYLETEFDVPDDAVQVWPWLVFGAPARGEVWMDDASFVVTGPATGTAAPAPPRTAAPAAKPGAGRRR